MGSDKPMSFDPVSTTDYSEPAEPTTKENRPVSPRLGKGESVIVGVTALLIYTILLLKLPYRSPAVNSLLSLVALSSFYFYLRLRLAIRVPGFVIFFLVFSLVIDIIGNQFGLFSRRFARIPYDIITHFLATGLSSIAVMWLLLKLIERFDYRLPLGAIAFFAATTTFSLAAYYEITELMDERWFGGHRLWTPRDSVQDLAAGLSGIVLAIIAYTLILKRRQRL